MIVLTLGLAILDLTHMNDDDAPAIAGNNPSSRIAPETSNFLTLPDGGTLALRSA